MYMGFSSPELTGPAITDYLTRVVQPLLATVPGVAQAEILGGQPFAMRVWLDPDRLAARGISAADVQAAIRENNFQSAPGQAKGYFNVIDIVADTGLTNLEDFREMVVKAADGGLVRLRDVATIELGAQSSNSSVTMNGESAVFIGVNATPTGNPLNIVAGVREILPTIQRGLPPTVQAQVVYDSTRFIQSSIDEVTRTLIEAVGIVIVVIFLFLGSIRSVLIPVVTIPLSIIGGCMLMLALGFSLNLLTLLAMVLAIGLVVDDAIVVVENVHRHIEEGLTPVQASLVGAREIAGPVIAMTITLAAVYAPIGFLTGLTGSLFREFAFTLAGAVIISGVVALTLSPMMCSLILKGHGSQGRFADLIDRTFTHVTDWYGRRLDRSLDFRPVTALFAVVVLGITAFLFLHTKSELAPEEDQGIVFSLIKAPQYANLDYVDAYGKQLDEAFASFPETDTRFVVNGMQGGPNSGIAGMILKPWDERERTAMELNPAGPGQAQRDHRRAGVRLLAAAAPGLDRRPAGADGDQLARRIRDRLRADGGDQGRRAQERHVHRHRQRPRLQQPGDPGQHRPVQGQRPGHHHGLDRRHAGHHGRRQLRQPIQSERPLLRGDPAGAACPAAEPGEPGPILRHDPLGRARPALHRGAHRGRHGPQRADPVQPAQLGHLLGRADARASPWARPWRSWRSRRKRCCRPTSSTRTCPTRGSTSPRATSWRLPSPSRW